MSDSVRSLLCAVLVDSDVLVDEIDVDLLLHDDRLVMLIFFVLKVEDVLEVNVVITCSWRVWSHDWNTD